MDLGQIGIQIALAVSVGIFTSIMAKLASASPWSNKKFAYTMGLTFISGLVAVNALEGGVNENNVVKVFLEILGINFIQHTGIDIAGRLKNKK